MSTFRSAFFNILRENSIEFLTYSVDELDPDHPKQSRKMPFLIIPNQKKQWFSFIY